MQEIISRMIIYYQVSIIIVSFQYSLINSNDSLKMTQQLIIIVNK